MIPEKTACVAGLNGSLFRSWSADPLATVLFAFALIIERAARAGHQVGGDDRRPVYALDTRRHDGHRPDLSRQMAPGLFRVYVLSK